MSTEVSAPLQIWKMAADKNITYMGTDEETVTILKLIYETDMQYFRHVSTSLSFEVWRHSF